MLEIRDNVAHHSSHGNRAGVLLFLSLMLSIGRLQCLAGTQVFSPSAKGPWIEERGVIRCIEKGRIRRRIKAKGRLSWNSPAVVKQPYERTSYLVGNRGEDAMVFEYRNNGSSVTYYSGGCEPLKTHWYGNHEVFRPQVIDGGKGFLAALVTPNYNQVEEYENATGYIIQWDRGGNEKFKAGPYDLGLLGFPEENIFFQFYYEGRYGRIHEGRGSISDLQGKRGYLIFDLVKGQYYFTSPDHGIEISEKGKVIIFQVEFYGPDGKKIVGDILPPGYIKKRIVIHEYQFP